MFMTTLQLQQHQRHLDDHLARLQKAAPRWSRSDRLRGEASTTRLLKEIARTTAELAMAGTRARKR
jgi:hypothetical protein